MTQARALVDKLEALGKTQSEIARLTGFTISKVKRSRAEKKGAVQTALKNAPIAGGLKSGAFYVCDLGSPSLVLDSRRICL